MWTEITRPKYDRTGLRDASDLSDGEWRVIEPHMPAPKALGRPRTTDLREVGNASLYVLRSGGPWRLLPNDLPPRSPGPRDCAAGRDEALGARINHPLLRAAREAEGREASPAAGVIDSQSVKTTDSGGPRGFDAGKQSKGRKRPILTDPGGLLGAAQVHAANIQDRDGAPAGLASIRPACPWLRHVFAAGASAGPKLAAALERIGRWPLEIVQRPAGARGFDVLPRRWGGGASAHWPGGTAIDGSQRTSRPASPPPKPGSSSPAFNSSPEDGQDIENKHLILGQTLRETRCLRGQGSLR